MLSVSIEAFQALEKKLAGLPDELAQALREKSRELADALIEKIRIEKLSGDVLQSRSGTLQNSIKAEFLQDDCIGFNVSADTPYAAAQEYGFSGSEAVTAHLRTINQAFGRAISPKTIVINSFTRNMHLPEANYMRSSLEEMQPEIERALSETVISITAKGLQS